MCLLFEAELGIIGQTSYSRKATGGNWLKIVASDELLSQEDVRNRISPSNWQTSMGIIAWVVGMDSVDPYEIVH